MVYSAGCRSVRVWTPDEHVVGQVTHDLVPLLLRRRQALAQQCNVLMVPRVAVRHLDLGFRV